MSNNQSDPLKKAAHDALDNMSQPRQSIHLEAFLHIAAALFLLVALYGYSLFTNT